MRTVFIKYNPYRLVTEITIDGQPLKKNSKLNFEDRRLQEWVEDLPKLLYEECSTREFKIKFHGTLPDYEDMYAMAQDAKSRNIHITLQHIPAKEVKDKEKAIQEIFDEIQRGPFDELKQPDVKKAFQMARNSEFEVTVVGTMSAGKSTFMNSILRQKLMPAKSEKCTAIITEIKDNGKDDFRACVYDKDGKQIQTHSKLTYEIMQQLNQNPKVSRVRTEGNIPFVTSDDVSLVLVDTPGPNSRDPEHKKATYRALSQSSKAVVLYIMNATQLAVNDDNNLLKHVAESMNVGGKQSRDRFIFVVNKLDDFKMGEDSVEAAIKNIKEYLKDHGIENPNIYPASALTALNIRTILSGRHVDDDNNEIDDERYEAKGKVRKINRYEEMHFEKYAPLTPSARREIEQMLEKAVKDGDANQQALIHSGIVSVEAAIRMYVQKYARTAKIKNIADTFTKKLESARSLEAVKQEISAKQDKKEEVLNQIEAIKKKLASGEEGKKFKKRIENINYDKEIQRLANEVINEAQQVIEKQLTSQDDHLTKREAEYVCKEFKRLVEDLKAEVQVKLEDLCSNCVKKHAEELLWQYKKKIQELAKELNAGSVEIQPFKMMEGAIGSIADIEHVLQEAEKTEMKRTVVGNHKKYKELFGFRRWLHKNIGVNFNVDYKVIDDYDWVENRYIDGNELAAKVFGPLQKSLYEVKNLAGDYAKEQTKIIKREFLKKFDQLDAVLADKLKDLEKYAKESRHLEGMIRENYSKLAWLEWISKRVNDILEI